MTNIMNLFVKFNDTIFINKKNIQNAEGDISIIKNQTWAIAYSKKYYKDLYRLRPCFGMLWCWLAAGLKFWNLLI